MTSGEAHPPGEGRAGWLRSDLLAGLTVALVAIPQALAYALVAGLPPAYGLSTSIVVGFVAALAGRSPQVSTGPTNTTGLLILAALFPWLAADGLLAPSALSVLATLTLLAGALRIVAAFLGGAHLVRFLPISVLTGFAAGAGLLISSMQLDEALGLPPVRASGLVAQIEGLAAGLGDVRLPALLVAVATAAAIAVGGRYAPRFPFALVAVVSAAALSWALGLDATTGLPLVGDRASVRGGWPPGALPSLDPDLVTALLGPASAIVLLGTLELTVSASAGGARPDMKREILAQGLSNVAGAFASSFPGSASFTRSMLLRMGGARTRLAAATSALLALPILFGAGRFVAFIPQASLAGVLFVVAWKMVDANAARRLWRTSVETRVLLASTLVATLVLPLEWAIFLGTGTGLVIHLARTSAPRLTLLASGREGLARADAGERPRAVVLEVSGDLHYAAVPPFVEAAERLVPREARVVVVDLSHAHQVRYAAITALEAMAERVGRSGGRLLLAGVDDEVAGLLRRSGSPLSWVPASPEPGGSARTALETLAEPPAAGGGAPGDAGGGGGEASAREAAGP